MKANGFCFSRWLAVAVMVISVLGIVNIASAQEGYPSKPVRFVVNVAAGGYGDITSRLVANKMGENMGQRFLVENRPGAGQIVAAMAVLQAPADGYTITLAGQGSAVSHTLFKKLPYDILNDFAQVSVMVDTDLVVLVKADSKFTSLASLLQFAKSNPGKLNIGTSYVGSTQQLAAELFKKQAGINAVTVTYKSAPEAIIGLRSGSLDVVFDVLATSLPQIKDKSLKALAVASDKRFAGLPDVPTTEEAGLAGYQVTSWNGISVKAGTPRPIIDRLNKEIGKALTAPDVKQKCQDMGLSPVLLTPDQSRKLMVDEIAKWKKVIEDANIPRQ
ncbi:MAG: tripartite tricarboxylate transporter substrate binding protein [Deltaproteobacteria bacterium]|nr:tripartite tricarboxylate transporter substrate binding protein [Deltaproteobacteria bacterium]